MMLWTRFVRMVDADYTRIRHDLTVLVYPRFEAVADLPDTERRVQELIRQCPQALRLGARGTPP